MGSSRRSSAAATRARRERECVMGKLPKFSLARLVMCGGGYQRLSSQEYLRLGLCLPDSCSDCAEGGSGHYVKNDKMVKNNLLLNNQVLEDKVCGPQPLKKIVNNLANETTTTATTTTTASCNRCKESSGSGCDKADPKCSSKEPKKSGFVNLAFVDTISEASAWYQPHLPRELAVKILSDCSVGSFIVRTSQSQVGSGCLALTVRVPKSFNGTGILHYLIVISESGFRIKGFSKVFSSLSGLVVHHSVMKEALPCRLVVGEEDWSEDESDRESDFADLDADPEYPGLLSRLRAELSH